MDYSISLTGNKLVDEISRLHLLTIPQAWYKTIRQKCAPNALAILVLQDLIYWYTWTEVRSEETGAVVSYKKKFKADLLQRSYEQLAERFGITKRQAYDVIFFLEQLGVLTRIFRTVNIGGMKCSNVLFIQLNPSKIREISDERNNLSNTSSEYSEQVSRNSTTGSHENRGEGLTKICNTNTNTSTSNTTNITHTSERTCEENKNLSNVGELQKYTYNTIATHNAKSEVSRKIPISNSLISFVQKEFRELLEEHRDSLNEVKTAIDNYILVSESDTWKKFYGWRDFIKNFNSYTSEYFDIRKFVNEPKQTTQKEVSAEYSESLTQEREDLAEKERIQHLKDIYDDFTPIRKEFVKALFAMYQENGLYQVCTQDRFNLEFAEVADELSNVSSKVLKARFEDYFKHSKIIEPLKAVVAQRLINLEE